MNRSSRQRGNLRHACGIRIALLLVATVTTHPMAGAEELVEVSDPRLQVVGITAPSRRATLASVRPARIAKLLAEEGAAVHAGEQIVALDDGVQTARTDIARAKAESTLRTNLAHEKWKRAKREVDRLLALHGEQFATSKETDDAVTAAEIARLNHELEIFEHTQTTLAHRYEQRLLAEYRIHAPFDGYITEHHKHVGETVDQLEGIVTIVRLDPLDVLLDCPTDLAPLIMVGDEYPVTPLNENWPPQAGAVTFVSKVIDGASQTFKVRVSVENPDEVWLAGMKVIVDFTAPLQTNRDRHTAASPPAVMTGIVRGMTKSDCK